MRTADAVQLALVAPDGGVLICFTSIVELGHIMPVIKRLQSLHLCDT